MEPTAALLAEWKRGNDRYPDQLVQVERDQWPSEAPFGGVAIGAYRSRDFVVVVWAEPTGFTRLSINRTDWDERKGRFRDNIGWDDLQRLKAEAGYGDVSAVELYPPDDHVVNTANMRHLFLLPFPPPFMFNQAKLSEAA